MLAGFEKLDITPNPTTEPVFGLGYWFQRSIRFTGVRDPLFVRCAALGRGESLYFLIGVDAVLDSFGFAPRAAERISREFNIPRDRVWIACSHTHSAPVVGLNLTQEGADYGRFVEERIVEAAGKTVAHQTEATAFIVDGHVPGVLYNRRPILADGTVAELHGSTDLSQITDPGPINDRMTLIQFQDTAGRLVGACCHFGIHGVCIQCSDQISADCMGRAIQRAEIDRPDPAPIIFLNGPCGDIDPAEMGSEQALNHTTDRLYEALFKLLNHSGTPRDLNLKTSAANVFSAKRRSVRSESELDRLRTQLEPRAHAETNPRHHAGPGYELFLLNQERVLARMPQTVDIEYRILNLADLILVGLPGELFTDFGLGLAREFQSRRVLVVSHVNGWLGYFPLKKAFDQSGYEVTPSPWSRLAPGQTEQLFNHICQRVSQL